MFMNEETSVTDTSPLKMIKLTSGICFKTTSKNLSKIKKQLHKILEKDVFLDCEIASSSSDLYNINLSSNCILCLSNTDVNELLIKCDENEKEKISIDTSSDEDADEKRTSNDDDGKNKQDEKPDKNDKHDQERRKSDKDEPDDDKTKSEKKNQKRKKSIEKSGSESDSKSKGKSKRQRKHKTPPNSDDEEKSGSESEENSKRKRKRQKNNKPPPKTNSDDEDPDSSDEEINRINRAARRIPTYKSIKNLIKMKYYKVLDCMIVTTSQGKTIRLKLEDESVPDDKFCLVKKCIHRRDLAKKRQAKKRKRDPPSKQKADREKARIRMKNLRKIRRSMNKKANKKYNAERKKIMRDLKKCGCKFKENGTVDILQHNFLCYEKSLQWHECVDCNKRIMISSHSRVKCKGHCELFSSQNHMDPLPVPEELLGLTYIEKQLISRVHSVFSLYKVEKGQYKYKGQVINFPQQVQSVADSLPHLVADLNNLVVVKLSNDIDLRDFYVRKAKVLNALVWLKAHHPLYSDIHIDEGKVSLLPTEGSVFNDLKHINPSDNEHPSTETNSDDSNCDTDNITSSGVPDLKDPSLNNTLHNTLIWPSIGPVPINEFGSPGYLTLCFPYLFPYAEADYTMPRKSKISLPAYIQHLMLYKDERFAKDERFRYFMMNSQMRWNALNLGNLYVKKNEFFSKMTISQLKEYLSNDKSMVKQIMYYGSRIRSTKSYWNSRCGELLDMVQQIGDPTVFFTLSAADYYWPNLFRLLDKDVKTLNIKERADLIAANPLVADSYFYLRSKFFINHCFKPHFGVKDVWFRYEFQHRGSVHLHGLACIVSCENPNVSLLPSQTHPCEITLSEVDNLENDLADLCNHVQRHTKCRKGFCLKEQKGKPHFVCKYNFPKQLQEYSTFEYKDNEITDIAFKRNDPFLNKYNSWVLQTWRANIDFSPIFSKAIVYRYIAKYASKSEIKSQAYNEIMTTILDKKCAESENCKQAIRKLLLSTCAERDYCAQEVFHFLMGYHFYEKTRDIVIINLSQRDWVSIHNGFGSNNVIDNYMERSTYFEKLSIYEYSKWFYVSGGAIKRRKNFAVVRFFPRYRKEFDEYAYYQWMSQVFYPWREIADVSYIDEEIRGYVDKCVSHYTNLGDYIKNEDNESDDINDNCSNKLKSNEQILSEFIPNLRKRNLGKEKSDTNYSWDRYSCKLKKEEIQIVDNYLRKDLDFSMISHTTCENLNAEQIQFLNYIKCKTDQIANNEESYPIFCMLQGMPGTGKSYLLRECVKYISVKLGCESVKVVAPTGVAAKNVDGCTLHSFLLLGKFGFTMKNLNGPDLITYREKYGDIKFLFVEECSMVGLRMLACLEKRCREIYDSESLFGNLNVILIGDVNQLLPISDQPLYAEVEISTKYNNLLERGKLIIDELKSAFILRKCHRFANQNYINFLRRISSGRCTERDVETMNKRCLSYLSSSEMSDFDDSLRICTTNDACIDYNLQQLQRLNVPTAIIKAQNNNQTAFTSSDDMADGLLNDLYLAEGAKVMLRKNLNVSRGLVNGCVGILKYFIYEKGMKPPALPVCVLVKFANINVSDLDISLIPIVPSLAMWYRNGITCTRFQLPIVLCWACTVHRSQGLTLQSMILDVGNSEFALGLLYVALSRVSDKENLCLVIALTLDRL
ncbi:ATP-dependent DNA helicase, partial [Frankliniella fusca]